jgi:hypothetical protein
MADQTWETSDINLVRWLAPLLLSLGLGWFLSCKTTGHEPWLVSGAMLIAWPIAAFVGVVQTVRYFFRSIGIVRKLGITVVSLAIFLMEWAQLAEVLHIGP